MISCTKKSAGPPDTREKHVTETFKATVNLNSRFKNNEKQRVYDALTEIIDKDDERTMACIKCYDKLKSNYTWDIVSDKVIELT